MPLDITIIEDKILEIIEEDTEKVTLTELTQENLETGNGVFDVLMRSMEEHLQREHTANRITGDQYAAVYTTALTQVMQSSIQFLLGKNKAQLDNALTLIQVAKLDKEILRTCAEIERIEAETLNVPKVGLKLDQDLLKGTAEINVLTNQFDKITSEIERIDAETLNVPKVGLNLDQDLLKGIADIDKINSEIERIDADTLNVPKVGLKLDQDLLKGTAEINRLNAEVLNVQENTLQITESIGRIEKETLLLCQKVVTEKAQVLDELILNPTEGDTVTRPVQGTVAKKNDILQRQKNGYDDNYKTQVASQVLDAYKILASSVDDTFDFPPSLDTGGIDYLLKTLKQDSNLQDIDNTPFLGLTENAIAEFSELNDDDQLIKNDYYWKLSFPAEDHEHE